MVCKMDVVVVTGGVVPGIVEVELEVSEDITSLELINLLVEELELIPGRGAWYLQQEWQGCRELLPMNAPVPQGDEVKLELCSAAPPWKARSSEILKNQHTSKKVSRDLGKKFMRSPGSFISAVPNCRWIHCMSCCLEKRLDRHRRKYSGTLLQRLGAGHPLWGPQEPSPLESLRHTLSSLEENNLTASTEVSDMNIKSTRIQQLIAPLHVKVEKLSGELSILQEEVKRRREERNRNAPKNVEQLRTDLTQLHEELEMKNQLNSGLNSKIQKLKDHLKTQRKVLEEKKREIEQLKGWNSESYDLSSVYNGSHVTKQKISKTKTPEKNSSKVTNTSPSKKSTPSTSKKRHASILEAKNRQLVEEEGQVLKQHSKQPIAEKSIERKGVWPQEECDGEDEEGEGGVTTDVARVLMVPSPDRNQYKETHSSVLQRTSEKLNPKNKSNIATRSAGKSKKEVRFEAEAIILNAALEGELGLLKDCVRKLGGCGYHNDKGATCLHNAVCSGNLEVVSYLVDQTCDVNLQDIDGWTALHCAVAYSNLEITKYLVEHGASLFLETVDGDTPLDIAKEEHKLAIEAEEEDETNLEAMANCLKYLRDMESGLGVLNGGQVFVLFSRHSREPEELSLEVGERLTILECGEEGTKWWMARNGRGQRGEVPSTFLGLYQKMKDDIL